MYLILLRIRLWIYLLSGYICIEESVKRTYRNILFKMNPEHWYYLTFIVRRREDRSKSISRYFNQSSEIMYFVLFKHFRLVLSRDKTDRKAKKIENFCETDLDNLQRKRNPVER